MRSVFRPSRRYSIEASPGRNARALREDAAPNTSFASPAAMPCACGGGCPRCNASSAAPLTVDRDGGTAEREADRAAASALRGDATRIQARPTASHTATAAPSAVHDTLRESGAPLPTSLRSEYSARMGHDFSPVRVHTGAEAKRSASTLNAEAYTVGSHIAFADGRYAPDTPTGRELIGHELAHVAQQAAGPPRVQKRGPKDKGLETLEKRVDETLDAIRQGMEKAEQDDYVRSVVGDFVLSKNLVDYKYVRKPLTESHKDSKLTTETYYIAVQQRPAGKDTRPWMVIVDRRISFDLHGKHKGKYHVRQSAQLQSDYATPPAPAKLIGAQATTTSRPDTLVVFEKPDIFSAPVSGSEKPAPTLAKRSEGNALFDFGATAKQKVEALEKLIPGYAPLVPDPAGDRIVKAPPKPPPPKPRKDDTIVQTPTREPTPKPADTDRDKLDQAQRKLEEGGKIGEVEQEVAKKKDDPWWAGLLRALASILIGLAILAAVAVAVVAVVFAFTGVVIGAAVAAAVAGAILLGYGLYKALKQRLNQKEYEGRTFSAIGRALLDTVGITGIQEAITGEDAGTGKPLTTGERVERGILGGVSVLTLLWGGLKGRGKPGAPGGTVEPAPVPRPAPVPIEPVPAPVPTPPRPAPVPVEPTPAPVPVEPTPVPTPTPKAPEPIPLPKEPAPAPAPREPALAPEQPAPAPTPKEPAPTPTPKEPAPAPTPKEPTPAPTPKEPAPAPQEPTPTPVPKGPEPTPSPKAPEPAPSPKDPAPQNARPRTGARARIEEAQQGLRDAIERLKQKIATESKEHADLAEARSTALSEMQKHKQDALRMGSKHPDYRSTLEKFRKAKEAFEELDGQYQAQAQRIRDWVSRKAELTRVLNDKTYERPTSYNSGVEGTVWENAAKEGGGVVKSPSGVEIKPGDPWVMGHKPGLEFWKHQVSAARRGLTRDQFLREHNNPKNYRPETPADNSSHAFEAPDNVSYWP